MAMTVTEKILANASGNDSVTPGQVVQADLSVVLGNDITAPLAIQEFHKMGATKVFDPKKVVLVPDHFAPNKDIKAAEQTKVMREFAYDQGVIYFEVGQMGVEHALLPEQGIVAPGMVIIGADSHTCTYGALGAFSTGVGSTDMAAGMATGELWFKVPPTMKFVYEGEMPEWVSGKDLILHTIGLTGVEGARYKAMEFAGDTLDTMSMDQRMTIANMAIEAGAKNGIFAVDQITRDYLDAHYDGDYQVFESDDDATYESTLNIDVSQLEPVIALPHLPSNTKPVSEVDVAIDQVVIGSCTNGRLEDLRVAAEILKGQKCDPKVRTIIIPATQQIYLDAMKEGLLETFIESGAVVSTPTCGPCLGGHMGILAAGERAVATTNRNFLGRMGHPESEVYLSSPAVAAASAVTGRITHPAQVASKVTA